MTFKFKKIKLRCCQLRDKTMSKPMTRLHAHLSPEITTLDTSEDAFVILGNHLPMICLDI